MAGCLGLVANLRAQTAYPMLMSISPVAAQAGAASEHTFRSRYSMEGAYQVWVSGQGVQAEVVPLEKVDAKGNPNSGENLKVKFTVAADALPGVRDVRVATPRGVSTVRATCGHCGTCRRRNGWQRLPRASATGLPAGYLVRPHREERRCGLVSLQGGKRVPSGVFKFAACDWRIASTISRLMPIQFS